MQFDAADALTAGNRAVDHEIREVALAREEVCGSARVKKNGEDPRAAT